MSAISPESPSRAGKPIVFLGLDSANWIASEAERRNREEIAEDEVLANDGTAAAAAALNRVGDALAALSGMLPPAAVPERDNADSGWAQSTQSRGDEESGRAKALSRQQRSLAEWEAELQNRLRSLRAQQESLKERAAQLQRQQERLHRQGLRLQELEMRTKERELRVLQLDAQIASRLMRLEQRQANLKAHSTPLKTKISRRTRKPASDPPATP